MDLEARIYRTGERKDVGGLGSSSGHDSLFGNRDMDFSSNGGGFDGGNLPSRDMDSDDDPNGLDFIAAFHTPANVVNRLRQRRFYFEFDPSQLREMYDGFREGIEEVAQGNGAKELVLGSYVDTLALWDYQFAYFVLSERKGLDEDHIKALSEEEMLRSALEYLKEDKSQDLAEIQTARERAISTLRRYTKKD